MSFYGWLSSCVCWSLSVVSRSAHDAPPHMGAAKCCLQKFGIFQEVKEKALYLFSWMSRISKHLRINLVFLEIQKLLWNVCLHLNIKVQRVEFGVGMEFKFPNCVFINVLLLETTNWCFNQTLSQERASQVLLFVCFAFSAGRCRWRWDEGCSLGHKLQLHCCRCHWILCTVPLRLL